MANKAAKYYMYRNLHTGGFSIKHKGHVCARGDIFIMNDVEFRVSRASQDRARETKQKNVHAFAVADNFDQPELDGRQLQDLLNTVDSMTEITYNPFRNRNFINSKTKKPVKEANQAMAINGKLYIK